MMGQDGQDRREKIGRDKTRPSPGQHTITASLRGVIVLLLFFLVGCDSAPSTVTPPATVPPASLWGEVVYIDQAEQLDAPTLLLDPKRITSAWIGVDEYGAHHFARQWDAALTSDKPAPESTLLYLPLLVHPYAFQLAPAQESDMHMLWLDAAGYANSDDGSRLFLSHLAQDLTVTLAAVPVSNQRTLRYTWIANKDGSLWVVWSGGLLAEPGLYTSFIDPHSRPRAPQRLVTNADWPTLVRADDGTVYLFWLSETRVFRAELGDGVLLDAQPITDTLRLEPGDRLKSLQAGLDHTRGYLFWNVTRADGTAESWYSSGALTAETWNPPKRLTIGWTTKATFETGYNSGMAFPAWGSGNHPTSWATPAAGQYTVLAIAAQVDDGLALVYLQSGEVVGYQEIIPLTANLIGLPVLFTDRNRHLVLAWAEPNPQGYADLKLTTTRSR